MATTSISLVRPQTERVRPPRALWVPFALGRPLGAAGDPAFQTEVLRAAFALLDTATEPTIADYPLDAPTEAGPGQWSCPLSLAVDPDESMVGRLLAEVDRLRPWAAETRRRRGRTLFGASGASPDQVDEVAVALAAVATSGEVTVPPPGEVDWAFDMPLLLRHLADDLRGFYHEGVAARPGADAPNHDALNDWIFGGTVFGEVLTAVADHLTAAIATHPMAQFTRGFMIPEGRYRGGSAFAQDGRLPDDVHRPG
ncbi:MAG: hypothetical protein AAGD35_02250 [Actinomycetota bacterium]